MDNILDWIVPELIAFACGYCLRVFAEKSGLRLLSKAETEVLLSAMQKHITELEHQQKLGVADNFELFQAKSIVELIKAK
jgi:hypothetical protein